MKHIYFAIIASLGLHAATAQSTADFENLALPGTDTNYAGTLPADSFYQFQSGNVMFFGSSNSWGSYADFNYSNVTDNRTPGYQNDKSAITGMGVDSSEKYAICYVTTDFNHPTHPDRTIPSGVALLGAAKGETVAGVFITNSTYAYYYMQEQDFKDNKHWFMLTVRGYLNGTEKKDSVNLYLADFRPNDSFILDSWEWLDLTPLGKVDSLTFDLSSDDKASYGINVPAYFALDNLVTLDGTCPNTNQIYVEHISSDSVVFKWSSLAGVGPYEVAIDKSMTLAPSASGSVVDQPGYVAKNLEPNTVYTLHVRALCSDDIHSDWDTLMVQTPGASHIDIVPKHEKSLVISPNPASDYLSVHAPSTATIEIYDLLGRAVLRQVNDKPVNISQLESGVYLLKVYQGGEVGATRFIKR